MVFPYTVYLSLNYYHVIMVYIVFVIDVDPNMPVVRDPDQRLYIREWSGGILAGHPETNGKPCFEDGIPEPFEFQLLPEDWDHMRKFKRL